MTEHFDWVTRIIESCKDGFQLDVARACVELFKDKYGCCYEHSSLVEVLAAKDSQLMIK